MRSESMKLDLDLGVEKKFDGAGWFCVVVYALTVSEEHLFSPSLWWEWGLLVGGVLAFSLKWFYQEYYIADFRDKKIWRCSGNRMFMDNQTVVFENDAIHSFAIDLKPGKHGGYQLVLITPDAELHPMSDISRWGTTKLEQKGKKVADGLGKPFYFKPNSSGLTVLPNEDGELVVSSQELPDWQKASINWWLIAAIMTPILIGFVWLMYIVQQSINK